MVTAFVMGLMNALAQTEMGQVSALARDSVVSEMPQEVPAEARLNYEAPQMEVGSAQMPLNIPTLTSYGTMPSWRWPYRMWGGWHAWDVHEGLNVSLGASVFSTFGSGNTYKGAGFSQTASLVYAKPLTEKLSIAVGGYLNNMTWAHADGREAGLTAVLGYQFDEHWSGYVYGQKSLMTGGSLPYPMMDMTELGDRVGAAVRYNFNPAVSVQVSFEYVKPQDSWRGGVPFENVNTENNRREPRR